MFGKKTSKKSPVKSFEIDADAVNAWFDGLDDDDESDVASMEGIAKLAEQLGLDPAADVRVLVLLWRLGALEKSGQISRSEFIKGLTNLHVSKASELIAHLPSFDTGFLEKSEFRGSF